MISSLSDWQTKTVLLVVIFRLRSSGTFNSTPVEYLASTQELTDVRPPMWRQKRKEKFHNLNLGLPQKAFFYIRDGSLSLSWRRLNNGRRS